MKMILMNNVLIRAKALDDFKHKPLVQSAFIESVVSSVMIVATAICRRASSIPH